MIAVAESGKTNTLAHRVAHLIITGADPRRILLMNFSRRAAAERNRRVDGIAHKVIGEVERSFEVQHKAAGAMCGRNTTRYGIAYPVKWIKVAAERLYTLQRKGSH